MNKPDMLRKGDKVAIVSLSYGVLGEDKVKHELDIALNRLEEYGLEVVPMTNSLKGAEFLANNPEARAEDLKEAFRDKDIKAIICATGGNDTYKTLPYLMEDKEFSENVKNNPKIFTGFSDTTVNHLMFNKLGLSTFYGPCLLIDIAELEYEMLPYTKMYFEKFFGCEEEMSIESSDIWYLDRENFKPDQIGVKRVVKLEEHGYEVLNGSGVVSGELFGGCIESIDYLMTKPEQAIYAEKYRLLPSLEEWKDKVLFLETSEQKPTPDVLESMLMNLKNRGILASVKGVIVGKPINEVYYEEYKDVYKKVFSNLDTPVLYNVNFGHAAPRCILPYNALTEVDYDNKKITVKEPFLAKTPNLSKNI